MSNSPDALQYPIGKFSARDSYSPEELNDFIERIGSLPERLAAALKGMSGEQLDTPYRDGGWTVRQVTHHIADSHMNAYIRLKWTLTEETPTIKAYEEKLWAVTPETHADPSVSIHLITALHAKWVLIIKALGPSELSRQFFHPDSKKHVRIDTQMGMYAWHGDHHLTHITALKKRMGW